MCGLLCLASSRQRREVHSCHTMPQRWFLFIASGYPTISMGLAGSPPSPTDGPLGCFHCLAFVSHAALGIRVLVQVFVWLYVSVFLGCIPRSEAAGSHGKSVFNVLRKVNHLF